MKEELYALALTALAYSVITTHSLKGDLMAFSDDLKARLAEQDTKIDAAAARVLAALANVVAPADASAVLAKIDANDAKIDAFAAAAPAPAPAP